MFRHAAFVLPTLFMFGCVDIPSAHTDNTPLGSGSVSDGRITSEELVRLFGEVCMTTFPNHNKTEEKLRQLYFQEPEGYLIDELGVDKLVLEDTSSGVTANFGLNSSWQLKTEAGGTIQPGSPYDTCEVWAKVSDPQNFRVRLINKTLASLGLPKARKETDGSLLRKLSAGPFDNEIYVSPPYLYDPCAPMSSCPQRRVARIEILSTASAVTK